MKSLTWIRSLFSVAFLYEVGIGLAFLLAAPRIFAAGAIEPPNHWGYVYFPSCLLVVFGLMFAAVAARPARFRVFILPGIGLKISYISVTAFYWITQGVPTMWKPFAIIDLAFALGFLVAWACLRAEPQVA